MTRLIPWTYTRLAQWLSRRSPRVRERILARYPDGVPEGEYLTCWGHERRRRPQHFQRNTMGPREFILRFGRDAYRALPKYKIHHTGHRKAIRAER
jgi:hypothetical protein